MLRLWLESVAVEQNFQVLEVHVLELIELDGLRAHLFCKSEYPFFIVAEEHALNVFFFVLKYLLGCISFENVVVSLVS